MSKDSREELSLSAPLLKVQRHLSTSQQTIHVSQTHGKHIHIETAGNRQGHAVHVRMLILK